MHEHRFYWQAHIMGSENPALDLWVCDCNEQQTRLCTIYGQPPDEEIDWESEA